MCNHIISFSLEKNESIKTSFIKQRKIPELYNVYSDLDNSFYESVKNEIHQLFYSDKIALSKLKKIGTYIYELLLSPLLENKNINLFENNSKLFVFFHEKLSHIPIEIAYNGKQFLGIAISVIRLNIKNTVRRSDNTKISEAKSFIIIADTTKELKYAYSEGQELFKFIKKNSNLEVVDFVSSNLTELDFINILESYNIVHFAGHSYNTSNKALLKIGKNETVSSNTLKHIKQFPKFIFFNSCENNNLSYLYSLYSHINTSNQSNSIIGTQFKIYDNQIHQEAILIFYKELLKNRTVEIAFKKMKDYYYKMSNSQWICYFLYGNPYFKLTLTASRF